MKFHVCALTEMSQKLMSFEKYDNVLNINLFPSKHFYNLAHFVSLPHYAVFLDLYLDEMHQE